MDHIYGGKRQYEVYGDAVFPSGEECFNERSVEKGVFRKEYERMSNRKRKKLGLNEI